VSITILSVEEKLGVGKESPTEESPKESVTKLILLIEGLFQK
jgi:hypothetical protein